MTSQRTGGFEKSTAWRLGGVLAAVLLIAVCGFAISRLSHDAPAPQPAPYLIVEQSRGEAGLKLVVEMDPKALKSDIEEVTRRLLAGAPDSSARHIDFWLGPRGPFNPVYASVMLEPGQPNEPFRLYLHRH
jgi:anti-sigma-K factor RskA